MLIGNYIICWSILGSIIVITTEAYSSSTWPMKGEVPLEINRINEPRKRRCRVSGRRSGFNGETIPNRRINWEAIFDGKIIAAIGSLFTNIVKDESNRERLQRKEMRDAQQTLSVTLQKYKDILNDPVKFNFLRKQAAASPNYVNEIVR